MDIWPGAWIACGMDDLLDGWLAGWMAGRMGCLTQRWLVGLIARPSMDCCTDV